MFFLFRQIPWKVEWYRRWDRFQPAIFFKNESTVAFIPGKAILAACSTSWWESLSGEIPAALLLIQERAQTFNPRACPKVASGTVDMPTASAPRIPKARISAGVSNAGPDKATTRLREFSYRSLSPIGRAGCGALNRRPRFDQGTGACLCLQGDRPTDCPP